MKRAILIWAIIAVSAFHVHSQQNITDELKVAAQIAGSTERLAAYDKILEKHGIKPSAETSSNNTGKWISSVSTDPITDNKIIAFMLKASSGEGVYKDPVSLIIRWNEGKFELYINWESYLGQSIDVTFRVGDSAPETKRWWLSTNSKSSFYPVDPRPIIKDLLNADRAAARCTPYNESPVTAIFDTTGLRVVVGQYYDDLKQAKEELGR